MCRAWRALGNSTPVQSLGEAWLEMSAREGTSPGGGVVREGWRWAFIHGCVCECV